MQDQLEHHWIWVSKKAKLYIGALLRWGLQDSEAAAQPFINPSP
jgi:hypothetical protein